MTVKAILVLLFGILILFYAIKKIWVLIKENRKKWDSILFNLFIAIVGVTIISVQCSWVFSSIIVRGIIIGECESSNNIRMVECEYSVNGIVYKKCLDCPFENDSLEGKFVQIKVNGMLPALAEIQR